MNYWIYDNGGYWYPEDEQKIRTKNVCSLMKYGSEHHDTYYPVCYKEVNDKFEPPIMKQANVFSEGVEDIRLFVSQQTGKLMFIGSTLGYSYADKIRMIVGEYDIHTQETDRVDVLTNEIPLIFRKEVYATACLSGALVYLVMESLIDFRNLNLAVAVLAVIAIRIIAVRKKLSIPFKPIT